MPNYLTPEGAKKLQAELNQLLDRVGQRIAIVSGRPDYEWEFTLLSGSKAEAFCLPGGKMAVYEGILPVCANEAGLAALMSHEMVHALKHHGSDRMTRHLSQGNGDGVFQRLRDQRNPKHVEMMQFAYGIKPQPGSSRLFTPKQQSEAAAEGLTLMARAGYDPQEAEHFWARLDQAHGSQSPDMLGKHPSCEVRAAMLQVTLPRASSVYQGAPQRHGLGEQIPMQALAELESPQATPHDTRSTLRTQVAKVAAPAREPLRPTESSLLAANPAVPAMVADPALTDAPPWSLTAMSVAPAPIVQVGPAELPAVVSASLTTLPVSTPNVGAPTIEGPLVPPVASLVITASAEDSSDSIVLAHALPFPPDSERNPEAGDAPAWSDAEDLAEDLSPGIPNESSGWQPHQPAP